MNATPTVLYAEDDENDAFFMQRAFTKLQRRDALRIVANGQEAVDYLTGEGEFAGGPGHPKADIVFLDVKMPQMSGLEALSWIRARREFDAMPIVMFTSSTQQSDVEFSRKHGANAYVVKPSNADQLFRLVENVLAASRAVSPQSPRLAVEANVI
jgi:CheY-like chemotaxis protein